MNIYKFGNFSFLDFFYYQILSNNETSTLFSSLNFGKIIKVNEC